MTDISVSGTTEVKKKESIDIPTQGEDNKKFILVESLNGEGLVGPTENEKNIILEYLELINNKLNDNIRDLAHNGKKYSDNKTIKLYSYGINYNDTIVDSKIISIFKDSAFPAVIISEEDTSSGSSSLTFKHVYFAFNFDANNEHRNLEKRGFTFGDFSDDLFSYVDDDKKKNLKIKKINDTLVDY